MHNKKIMILVPSRDMVHSNFALCLSQATKHLQANGIEFETIFYHHTVISTSRQDLTKMFLESDCDYAFWLDTDMAFAPETPYELLQHDLDIVGCNCRMRVLPDPWFVGRKNGQELITDDNSPDLEEVDLVPHAIVMIHRSVYESMTEPYYTIKWKEETLTDIGEDMYFYDKAREKGYKLWCDHRLSKSVFHAGTIHFGYKI